MYVKIPLKKKFRPNLINIILNENLVNKIIKYIKILYIFGLYALIFLYN